MWSLHNDCECVVKDVYSTNIVGCLMFILVQKLRLLKKALKSWNKNSFRDVHSEVNEARQSLESIQQHIRSRIPLDDLLSQETKAQVDLQQALRYHDEFWKEKLRVN
ncbi:hypothetical protein AAZX31_01G071300 [Glycine max]